MKKLGLFLIALFILCATSIFAQPSKGGMPPSLIDKAISTDFELLDIPAIDVDKVINEVKDDGVLWVGRRVPVNTNMYNSGTWTVLPDGTNIWRLKLKSSGAKALAVYYDDFFIPEGGKLFLYNESKTQVIGAYTSENNHAEGLFSTEMVQGETVTLEYVAPHKTQYKTPKNIAINDLNKNNNSNNIKNLNPSISISDISYIYRELPLFARFNPNKAPGALNTSGACEVNVNCSPAGDAWQDEKRGVAVIYFTTSANDGLCSGTLINTTNNSGTPYFLTADHCGGSTATDADLLLWQFYFKYEATTCTNPGSLPAYKTISGCTRKAVGPIAGGSDFFLIQLNTTPDVSYSPYYNGWDRTNTAWTANTVSIHHPSTDIKKISYCTSTLVSSSPNIGGDQMATNSAWQVIWGDTGNGTGVTEGGSSGSPLFNSVGRQVGTLSGGSSECTAATQPDYYGKFYYHWDQNPGGTTTQLKTWLDPVSSGSTTCNGYDPFAGYPDFYGTPTTLYVGQTVNFTDITNGATTWSWQFEGGTPSTSTIQNPTNIKYNLQGTYRVSLTTNTPIAGTQTVEKVGYITVLPGAANTQIWCDDFTTPANWAVTNGAGHVGTALQQWVIGTDIPAGAYLLDPIVSTSGGNHALFDSDLHCTGNQHTHLTSVNGQNCSSYGKVYLTFQEYYRKWYDNTLVYVSTDNFVTSTSYVIHETYGNNDASGNGETQTIDISSVAGGNTNVKVRFTFKSLNADFGSNAGCGYSWQIDDVCLEGVAPENILPDPDFTASTTRKITTGQSVSYTNLSNYASTYEWTFEGGTPSSSTAINPTNIVYNAGGYYAVTLKAINANGFEETTKTDYIHVFYDCSFDSNIQDNDGVTYYNAPSPATWGYIPGHNSESTAAYADKYNINNLSGKIKSLAVAVGEATVVGGATNVTFTIWDDNAGVPGTVLGTKVMPVSGFRTGEINYVEFVPVAVSGTFYVGFQLNYPANLDTFACYLASGQAGRTNTAYVNDGTWKTYEAKYGLNATLYILPEFCYDKLSSQVPDVDFSADKTEVTPGTLINFIDQSTGGPTPTAWSWTLNGGTPSTSNSQTPSNINFASAGLYNISLTATNTNGPGSKTKNSYINVANFSTIAIWNFPNGSANATADAGSNANNTAQVLTNWGAPTAMTFPAATGTGASTNCASTTKWDEANAAYTIAWSATINTTGYTNIKFSSKQAATSADSPKNFAVYYDAGSGYQYLATVPAMTYTGTVNWNQGVLNTIQMPDDCNNVAAIELVWYKTDDVSVGGGTVTATATSLIDDIIITGQPCTTLPGTPGTITGSATVCQGQQGVAYSVPSITNATYYLWTLPTGATIASGNYTNSITVDFAIDQVAGNITVSGLNMCGEGPVSANYPVAINTVPTRPGPITGSQTVTNGQNGVAYSVPVVSGATSYTWTVPSFATIASGSTTRNITVNYACPGSTEDMYVHANNACGASQESYVNPITITCSPDADFSTNNTVICVGASVNFVDISTNSPTSYSWSFEGGTPSTSNATNPTITYNTAGTYSVTLTATNATGSNVETKTGYIVCGNPTLSTSTTSVSAPGACDGTATATPSGNSPFTYAWSSISKSFTGTTGVLNEITTNNYTSTVTGLGNLDGSLWAFDKLCVNITHDRNDDLDLFLISPTGTTVTLVTDVGGTTSPNGYANTCFIQSATSTLVTGATPPFNGDWKPESPGNLDDFNSGQNPNGTWTFRIMEDAGQGVPGNVNSWTLYFTNNQSSATATTLCEGTYNVTVTDANGCTATASPTVSFAASLSASITAQTNVACFGNSTGSATVTATGGTSPYTYAWSGGGTSATKSNLAAGTYTVTVTDANTNTATASVTITQPASALSASISAQTNVLCFGNSTGSATVTASGGTSGYTYAWTGGGTTTTKSSLAAGTYTVTITDANSCTATASATITQPASALSASITAQTNVLCNGGSTGSATVTASGGTAAYSYNWAGTPTGDGTITITGLVAGNYAVTITDANSCTATTTATITQPASALSVSISKTNVACFGNSTGSATATPAGGTSGYTYLWTGGATTASISSKPAGTYTVTVTDANNCTATNTATITQPASALSASITAQTDVNCFGNSTGSATVTASGGTSGYTYAWTGGGTTATKSSLTAGTYTVTVTDANSCTTTASTTITQPVSALSVSVSKTDVLCFGNSTGSATATPSGGTSSYTYAWTGGATTASITNKPAGTYSVTVTDINNCTVTETTTITQPASGLTVSISKTDVDCYGNATGSTTATPAGGSGSPTYVWTGGATTASITNLIAGVYTVTVTDASSCTATATTTISQPASALAANIIGTNVNCFGGSDGAANLIVTGGTPSNTYSWSNSATTEDLTGLSVGTYNVTVTDANSCTTTSSVTITQPSSALSASISSQTNVLCNGGNNGSATVSATGGTSAYTYLWSNGSSAATIGTLTANTYTVTVTDANGCTATASATITQPASPLSASITAQTNVSCNGDSNGSATVSVSGGTAGYTYLWSGGGTTATKSSLIAGTYSVTVTDANSCTANTSVTITQPSVLTVSMSKTDVSCNGGNNGTATTTVTGGTSPYNYLWSSGSTTASATNLIAGNYGLTVTDANTCTTSGSVTITEPTAVSASISSQTNVNCFGGNNGSATVSASGGTPGYTYLWTGGGTTATKNGLSSGTYTVTVTDNNSCSTTVSVTITEPTVLSASTSKTDVSCNALCDGSATAIVSGGTLPYSYSWSNLQSTQTATNLCATTYNLTVTDLNNCTATSSAVITEPLAIVISPSVSNATCGLSDGSASVTVSGGQTPYSYLWSTSATVDNISGVASGSYGVTVTDANGCSNTASADINDSGAPSATASSTNVTCNSACDGTAQVTASGGTSPYTYSWSNSATTASVASLCNATYSVTVTDMAGCKATASVTITQPTVLNASITSSSNVSCNSGNDGSATVSVSGGTSPYTYTWSNSASTATASGLSVGVYSVTVLDSKSCSKNVSVTISEPTAISITSSSTDVLCNGGTTGTASIVVSGGTPSYSYNWTSGGSTASESNLSVGSYTVTVTDANSCTNTVSVTINEPTALSGTAISSNITCNSSNDGSIALTVTGGTTSYSYLWSNSATTEDISGLSANNYSVTITDANGCQTNTSAIITEPSVLSATYTVTNVNCNGNATGAVNVTVTGGTTVYTYLWDNSATSEDLSGVTAGTYNLQVTDANGCQTTVNAVVTEPSALALTPSSTDATCGASNGSASVSVSGGSLPYTYLWSSGATSNSLSNVSAGSYDVTVTDGNGCTASTSIIINNAGAPSITVVSITNVTCFANADGDATINVTGGVTPYIYSWSNGAASASISGLIADSYTVTVTDAMGCTSLANLTVTEPLELTATVVGTDVSCNGLSDGSADLTVAGGTTTYSYNWTGGIISEDLTGIIAGTYNVTVTDANGCLANATMVINEPYELTLSYIVTDENLGNDGAINLTVVGGTSGYSFNWSNSASTEDLTGLTGGTYNVTVTDANGCTANASIVVNGIVCGLTASIVGTDLTCNGGSNGAADLTVLGGTGSYTYNWSNGATTEDLSGIAAGNYDVTATDVNSCTVSTSIVITEPSAISISYVVTDENLGNDGAIDLTVSGGTAGYTFNWSNGSTTEDLSALVGGTYDVTVTDASGCTNTASIVVAAMGCNLSASISATNVTCNGTSTGSADLIVTGGTSPFTFIWSNSVSTEDLSGIVAGNYDVTITDANSCTATASVVITEPSAISISYAVTDENLGNDGAIDLTVSGGTAGYTFNWSNGSTTEDLSALVGGTYDVTVTDANGCTNTASIVVNAMGCNISASATSTNVNCNGGIDGTVDLTVTGGTSPFNFNWSNGSTTEDLSGIAAGNYSVTVTDINLCNATASVVITEPTLLSATASSTNANCGSSDGTATVSVSGGVTPYSYLWSNGETTQSLTALVGGSYSVTVFDANSCNAYANTTVGYIGGPSLNFTTSNVTCYGLCNGMSSVSASGGTAPYTYSWSNGNTGMFALNICAGVYTVTATDATGCFGTNSVTITEPDAVSVSISSTNATCGNSDGSATANVTGGTAPYGYSWNTSETTQTINNLAAGNYSVSVSDFNGCNGNSSVTITNSNAPVVSATISNPSCFGQCTGIASVSSTGGTAPYTYLWWDGHSGQFAMNLCDGDYNVTSTDNSGCATTYVVSITAPSEIILVMDSVNASTSTSTDGSASVTATGGTSPYTYAWNNGGTTSTISGLLWGTYTVTVTDANGCTNNSSIEVSYTDAIFANSSESESVSVYPNPSNGEFEVLVSSKNNSVVTYKVYNIDGQLIYVKALNKTTNIQNSKIDIRNNARGIYNLEIRTEKGVHQKRLIIK